jgi:two-component system response regulator
MAASRLIVVVEDNPDDLFFLERALRTIPEAPELVTCRDGVDAITLLHQLKEHGGDMPLAIVSDLKMPMKSGFDLLQWRREHDWARDIPMVILSSSNLERDLQQASALGATAYYVKPENVQRLSTTLSEIVKKHCVHSGEIPAT